MATRTLYVSDADEKTIWKKAEKLSEGNLSKMVSSALEKDVKRLQKIAELKTKIKRLMFTYTDTTGTRHKIAFEGVWLIEGEKLGTIRDLLNHTMDFCSVAVTKKEQFLVLLTNEDEVGDYWVFPSFKELSNFNKLFRANSEIWYDQFLLMIGEMVGEEYAEFLDI